MTFGADVVEKTALIAVILARAPELEDFPLDRVAALAVKLALVAAAEEAD